MSIPDLVEVNRKWRPTRNSEGRLIHSTLEGVINFWKWFGDSKVVDSEGRPLVMYMGIDGDFDADRPGGVFLAYDEIVARAYGASIHALYAKAPRIIESTSASDLASQILRLDVHSKTKKSLAKYIGSSKNTQDILWNMNQQWWGGFELIDISTEVDAIRFTDDTNSRVDGVFGHETLFVFDLTQIKSATGNRGTFDSKDPVITNPPRTPVMSYAAAHKWEPLAAKRGVSQVARSARGFMRAYQRAGSWARLPEEWKRKRDAFVARHMAQVRQNREPLWKDGQPTRRALALIMWAYMPHNPRRNPANETPWSEERVLDTISYIEGVGTGEVQGEYQVRLKDGTSLKVQWDTIGDGLEGTGEGFLWIAYSSGPGPVAAGYLEHDDDFSGETGGPAWVEKLVAVSAPFRRKGLYTAVLNKLRRKLKVIYADTRYTPDNEEFWKIISPTRKITR